MLHWFDNILKTITVRQKSSSATSQFIDIILFCNIIPNILTGDHIVLTKSDIDFNSDNVKFNLQNIFQILMNIKVKIER